MYSLAVDLKLYVQITILHHLPFPMTEVGLQSGQIQLNTSHLHSDACLSDKAYKMVLYNKHPITSMNQRLKTGSLTFIINFICQ